MISAKAQREAMAAIVAYEGPAQALASRVRRLREMRGLTQDALADMTQMRAKDISRLETGRRTNIALRSVALLATALGTSTDYLLGRSSESQRLLLLTPETVEILDGILAAQQGAYNTDQFPRYSPAQERAMLAFRDAAKGRDT